MFRRNATEFPKTLAAARAQLEQMQADFVNVAAAEQKSLSEHRGRDWAPSKTYSRAAKAIELLGNHVDILRQQEGDEREAREHEEDAAAARERAERMAAVPAFALPQKSPELLEL